MEMCTFAASMEGMSHIKRLLLVYRAPRFSPHAQEKDKAILDAVAERLGDWAITPIEEEMLAEIAHLLENIPFRAVLSMARSGEALDVLKRLQRCGVLVLNTPDSIRCCNRRTIENTLISNGLETPRTLAEKHPDVRGNGFWIKKTDTTDSSANHVFFSETELPENEEILVQPNLIGECVKFYGVKDIFFHACSQNPFVESIRSAAFSLAKSLGLTIYGGDAILTNSGHFAIIDFNDFPSFSACREDAADAIARTINPINC